MSIAWYVSDYDTLQPSISHATMSRLTKKLNGLHPIYWILTDIMSVADSKIGKKLIILFVLKGPGLRLYQNSRPVTCRIYYVDAFFMEAQTTTLGP